MTMRPAREKLPLNLYRVSRPAIARVISNERLTPTESDDVRHIVIDLDGLEYPYVEGQSMGVLTPGVDERGKANKLRLYSIASSRLGDDGTGRTASLCVKRVVYTDPVSQEERRGVASNFLCDLRPGDELPITGPVGANFLLPDDPEAHLILVATGTGIAPFRAFLRRIYCERNDFRGTATLFFGVRTGAECLYHAELEEFRRFPGFAVHYALSREQQTADGRRLYVQHRMAEQVEALWDRINAPGSYLFVCGLKGMEQGIESVFEARAAGLGRSWPELRDELSRHGRYLIETY